MTNREIPFLELSQKHYEEYKQKWEKKPEKNSQKATHKCRDKMSIVNGLANGQDNKCSHDLEFPGSEEKEQREGQEMAKNKGASLSECAS